MGCGRSKAELRLPGRPCFGGVRRPRGGGGDGTKGNGAAKPIAVVGAPSRRIARVRRPLKYFMKYFEIVFFGLRGFSRGREKNEADSRPARQRAFTALEGTGRGARESMRRARRTNRSGQPQCPPGRARLDAENGAPWESRRIRGAGRNAAAGGSERAAKVMAEVLAAA